MKAFIKNISLLFMTMLILVACGSREARQEEIDEENSNQQTESVKPVQGAKPPE